MKFNAIKFDTAAQAMANVLSGDSSMVAIQVGDSFLVADHADVEIAARNGMSFAYLHEAIRADGRPVVVSVQVEGLVMPSVEDLS